MKQTLFKSLRASIHPCAWSRPAPSHSVAVFFILSSYHHILIDSTPLLDNIEAEFEMKEFFLKSMRVFTITGFILSFLLTLSIVPFSQTRTFHKSAKSQGAKTFKSFTYSNEYNLSSYLEESRESEREDNRNSLHFLSSIAPFSNSLLHYFRSVNFSYNLHSYTISQLYNIPPPFSC